MNTEKIQPIAIFKNWQSAVRKWCKNHTRERHRHRKGSDLDLSKYILEGTNS